MRTCLPLCLLALGGSAALAMEPLPKESGWNGYVSPTVSALEFRDNLVAGAGSLDVGTRRIESLDAKAKTESLAAVSLPLEVGYMFAEQGLYVFLGNRLEDFLRLDNSQALGARKDLGRAGILEASALFSTLATEVWADPYLTGADRTETDRSSGGARVGLAHILGSRLEASVSLRSIDIDNERSGEALGLSDPERRLLDRDGEATKLEILYPFLINARHLLVPALDAGRYDAEGDANSRNGVGLQVTHAYRLERIRIITNLALRQFSFDEKNPVFDRKQNGDEAVVSVSAFYAGLFEVPQLSAVTSLLYTRRDSHITFFDAEASVASLSLLYNF